jgi:hypothetical protein
MRKKAHGEASSEHNPELCKSLDTEEIMRPVPEMGQIVRLAGNEAKLMVKSINEDAGTVELVTMTAHPCVLSDIPIAELLAGEDSSTG